MNKIQRMKNTIGVMKWGDFALIGVTLIVCVILWGKLLIGFLDKGQEVEIVANGEIVLRYDLPTQQKIYESNDLNTMFELFSQDMKQNNETLIHITSQGIHFDLLFKDSKVRFMKSDCPDKVCVQTGFISKSGQIAACIPAKVLVRITGTSKANDIDIIIK